jgi:hypothetical protein
MAYMAAQFLKGNNNRFSSFTPIKVVAEDNRDSSYKRSNDTEFVVTLKTVDIEYECESCGHIDTWEGVTTLFCKSCRNQLNQVTYVEGNKYQEVTFDQSESEYLLEGLLLSFSKKINLETKIKLIGLLSAIEDNE